MENSDMLDITEEALERLFSIKYPDPSRWGWNPRIRRRFRHFTPDDYYEALVMDLVSPGCAWLDVGCGRHLFLSNPSLGRLLAERAGLLVGLDPDPTIDENTAIHRGVRTTMENFQSDRQFDLITMRMVAEHVADPERFVASISKALARGGHAVVYTVSRYSPIGVLTAAVPSALHHPIKRAIWGDDPKDTFPTVFRMNTRRTLKALFAHHGFAEVLFRRLDDCRTLSAFRWGLLTELCLWKGLRAVGLRYPEQNLLACYRKA
jgi:2-polyprenyl-3-methyl-5-hydroxy-6-metoxy-1,4-benzoquinol methylase